MITSIYQIREANHALGHKFFSPETMSFFRSRTYRSVYPIADSGALFVTSERQRSCNRRFTIRLALPSGEIETFSEFQAFDYLLDAQEAAELHAQALTEMGCPEMIANATVRHGRWYPTVGPLGDRVLLLRPAPEEWHCFHRFEATGSGSTGVRAATGGSLGDVIENDAQLATLNRLVLGAPSSLVEQYKGLAAARRQATSTD